MIRKVRRQPIKQVRVPRLLVHVVHGFHQPSAKQLLPVSIDESSRQPSVLGQRHETGSSGPAFGQWRRRFNAQFGIENLA
jgi:hypothetical protein